MNLDLKRKNRRKQALRIKLKKKVVVIDTVKKFTCFVFVINYQY